MPQFIHSPAEVKFYERYYGALDGAKIENVRMVKDEFDEMTYWPTFDAVLPDGTRLEVSVSMDEEGNGAGFLFGLPHPDPEKKGG